MKGATPPTQKFKTLQNVKKHSMSNLSFESENLEKRTILASLYHWESFRIMVLHKARKNLTGIQVLRNVSMLGAT